MLNIDTIEPSNGINRTS